MDITVILNAHREGILAHPSCTSIELAKAAVEATGVDIEVIVVMDRPNSETTEFFSHRAPKDWTIASVDFGDLGFARNEGIRLAKGKWVAFLDADDLFGVNWLRDAYAAAQKDSRLIVWHPEINIRFGREQAILCHIDMEEDGFDIAGLVCSNYWTALCFAPRALLEQVPYAKARLSEQIGFEDWTWNISVITRGAIHKVVQHTAHLIRMKERDSLVARATAAKAIPAPCGSLVGLLRADPRS